MSRDQQTDPMSHLYSRISYRHDAFVPAQRYTRTFHSCPVVSAVSPGLSFSDGFFYERSRRRALPLPLRLEHGIVNGKGPKSHGFVKWPWKGREASDGKQTNKLSALQITHTTSLRPWNSQHASATCPRGTDDGATSLHRNKQTII